MCRLGPRIHGTAPTASSQHSHLIAVLQLDAKLCLPALSLLQVLTGGCQLDAQPLAPLPLSVQLALQPCRVLLQNQGAWSGAPWPDAPAVSVTTFNTMSCLDGCTCSASTACHMSL